MSESKVKKRESKRDKRRQDYLPLLAWIEPWARFPEVSVPQGFFREVAKMHGHSTRGSL